MSEQLTPMVMGKIRILLSQNNLSIKSVDGICNNVCQEHGHEVLKNGKTVVLKRFVQYNAENAFNCVIVEFDGKKYIGNHNQFLEIEDLLAPIKAKSSVMVHRTSIEK